MSDKTALLKLLDAVEALTEPWIEHHAQMVDGRWVRTHTTRLDPLLTRLRAAADPNGAGTVSTGSTGPSRVPVNLAAIEQDAKITAQIRDWCRIAGADPTHAPHVDTITDLQRWHAKVIGDAGFDPAWSTRQLRSWMHQIGELLDSRAKTFEAHMPCPVCGRATYGDAINGGGLAVEVRYNLDDDGRMTDEKATCRACSTTWVGHESVLELAGEMIEKAEEHA